jgi:hypothetical protein
MRANIVMLAVLAGLGTSSFGAASAEAKNLSCISGISPSEQRLLRDCEPEPQELYPVIEVVNEVPPPPQPPEPAQMKHGEGGKGGGARGGRDHDARGNDSGGSHGAAN